MFNRSVENLNIPNSGIVLTVLDHRKLISEVYREHSKSLEACHSLNPLIFKYSANADIDKNQQHSNTSSNKRKKKKTPTEEQNKLVDNKFKLEIEELQKSIEFFLSDTKNQQAFQQPVDVVEKEFSLESITNEQITFPQFRGENQSESFTKISLQDREYFIPPKTSFYNYHIEKIAEIEFKNKFDLIILDPPWRNKYIRRIKRSQKKSSTAYEMLSNDQIEDLPIENLINRNGLVIIWCTNSYQHQNAILNKFLPKWKLKFLTKWYWIKMTNDGIPICNLNSNFGKKQPFETIFIACTEEDCNNDNKLKSLINSKQILLSVPSLIHSHKPPLYKIVEKYLPNNLNSNCLEIFARYLQPNFTSIGLEVLKLMDTRLYCI